MESIIKLNNVDDFGIYLSNSNENIIYLCSNNKEIFDLQRNCSFFSSQKKPFLTFEEFDTDFFSNNKINTSILYNRANCLSEINNDVNVILTTPRAIIEKISDPFIFQQYQLKLKLNEEYSLDDIIAMLIEFGYRKNFMASSINEYSVRGDIIDIAIQNEKGIRLIFNFNNLEEIKFFNLSTQVSEPKLESECCVMPSNEIVVNEDAVDLFKVRMQNFTINPLDRELIECMHTGAPYFKYYPFLVNKAGYLFNFITNCNIVYNYDSKEVLDNCFNKINNSYQSIKSIEDFSIPLDEYFISSTDEWNKETSNCKKILLSII